ncbi:MAG: hypothetical protein QNJ44_09025 [Rhodobacter sp.]|nr:hypothetical protein [Rhodobacter sp.]
MSPKKKVTSSPKNETKLKTRRKRTVRNFPSAPFAESLEFARKTFELGAGQPVRRLTLFNELGKSPDSSASRAIVTNSGKYGLTKGGYQADFIEITEVGKRSVDDDIGAREQAKARVAAAIREVPPFLTLYESIVGTKLPARAVLLDKAKEIEVPQDAAEEAIDTFILNLREVGLLQTISGAERVVTEDHLLDELPSRAEQTYSVEGMADETPKPLITSVHATFETTAFYITPIGAEGSEERKHSDLFLGSFVEPALESLKLKVVRADKIDKPGTITGQIIEYLLKSRLVIADLSFHNPNVFYELAIRHMIQKPVVQIIRAGERVPFDVGHVRTIVIDNTDIYSLVPKIDVFRTEISSQVRRALEDPDSVDNPLTPFLTGAADQQA